VEDIVTGNLNLLKTKSADGEALNIGGGKRVTLNQLYGYLNEEIGVDIQPIYTDEIKGDAKHTLSNVDKARELIGYEPSTTIREGIGHFVKWYDSNSDFYEV
jgi:UDP-glucose 4-epimerase